MDNDPNNNQPIDDTVPTNIQPQPVVEPVYQPITQSEPVVNNQSLPATNPFQSVDQTPFAQSNQPTSLPVTSSPKSKKKLLIIIIIASLLLVGGLVTFLLSRSGSNSGLANDEYSASKLNNLFDPEKPIPFSKDNKYGFLSTDGKIVIEPKYDSESSFVGNHAIVSLDRKKQIINRTGEAVLSSRDGNIVSLDNGYWLVDRRIYDDNLKQVTPDTMLVERATSSSCYSYMKYNDESTKTTGVVDIYGNITYTHKIVDSEKDFALVYKCSSVPMKNDYGLIASGDFEKSSVQSIINLKTGKVILEFKIDIAKKNNKFIELTEDSSYDGYIFFISRQPESDDDSPIYDYSVYIADDKIAYQANSPEKIRRVYDIKDQILEISYTDDKDITWYDIKNKKMLSDEPEYESPTSLSEFELLSGYSKYNNNGKVGMMKGEAVVLKSDYDSINYLSSDIYKYLEQKIDKRLVIASKNADQYSSFSIYDLKAGKEVSNFESSASWFGSSSIFIYYRSKDKESWVVYNLLTGKSINIDVVDNKQAFFNVYSNYFTYSLSGDMEKKIYNSDMKLIYS